MKTLLNTLLLVCLASTLTAQTADTTKIQQASATTTVTTAPAPQPASTPKSPSSCKFDFHKMYFGGGVGASFGTGSTNVLIQPYVGYRFTQILSAGVLFEYQYWSQNSQSTNVYGGGIFGQVDIPVLKNRGGLVVHAEYDAKYYDNNNSIYGSGWGNFLPCGAGIYTMAGRSRVAVVALWDLLHLDDQYNGGTPTLRVSVTF